ncbi:MAG: substrate-binding domain-containing protein [Proteobacteria bacterium]|nr:substrate-binding domain-containing protein [Pseudomonadota bacterium]
MKPGMIIAIAAASAGLSGRALADTTVAAAKAFVAAATSKTIPYTGPTTGPKAVPGKFIVYVSTDQSNGGARGVGKAVEAAAKAIGWRFRLIDGKGTASGQNAALSSAIALKPAGIVLGGLDAVQSAPFIEQADKAGIKVVGWNVSPHPGPIASPRVIYNVTQDPLDVAKAAALFAIAQSDGHANVVIFTTSEYALAMAKSTQMAKTIKQCAGCKVLGVENVPLGATATRMPQVTAALLSKFGKTWNYSLAINDLYYDYMAPGLSASGRKGDGPPYNVSAGDGSESAFQRIRSKQFQTATVAAPLELEGWQCVDELNRAFAGQPPATETDPVHLFTPDNIDEDGGKINVFNPSNGYKAVFLKIWGKSA